MFSLTTTLFYMLSAYVAFLIGYSHKLHLLLILLVPIGFIIGYLLDRFNSVKKNWVEDRTSIYRLIAKQYAFFIVVSGVFCVAGFLLIGRI